MTLNLTARDWTVAIGGKDFTPGRVSLEVGQDLVDVGGLVLHTGTLKIQSWPGLDESLDPQINLERFQTGQPVSIQIADRAGVLRGCPWGDLYVLSTKPEAIAESLEIEVGCWGALEQWRSSGDPDEPEPEGEDAAIATYERQALLERLLEGVTVADVAGSLEGQWRGAYADLQGEYVGVAGEVAYASDQPCSLWFAGQQARLTPITLNPGAPWHTATIGTDEALYDPQSGEPPVEEFICEAEIYDPASEFEADGEGCFARTATLAGGGSEYYQFCPPFLTSNGNMVETETFRITGLLSDADPSLSGIGTIFEERTEKLYDGANEFRLISETRTAREPRGKLLKEFYGELGQSVPSANTSIVAEEITTTYTYGEDGVVAAVTTTVQGDARVVAPRYATGNEAGLFEVGRSREVWFKAPDGRYCHAASESRAAAQAAANRLDAEEAAGGTVTLAMALAPVGVAQGARASGAGQTQPPATEYAQARDGQEGDRTKLEGRAEFEPYAGYLRRPRKHREQLDLAGSQVALQRCAQIGGAFRIGRHFGRSIRIDIPDAWFAYEPLKRLDVVEFGGVKSYLADGATIALTPGSADLYFPHLIYMGLASYQPAAPTGGPAIAVPAPSEFAVGQEVVFAQVPSGALPPEVRPAQSYFVVGVSPSGIQVATEPGGLPITLSPVAGAVVPPVLPGSADPTAGGAVVPTYPYQPPGGGESAGFVVIPVTRSPSGPRPVVPPYLPQGSRAVLAVAVAFADLGRSEAKLCVALAFPVESSAESLAVLAVELAMPISFSAESQAVSAVEVALLPTTTRTTSAAMAVELAMPVPGSSEAVLAIELAMPVLRADSRAWLAVELAMVVAGSSNAVLAVELLGLPLESAESLAVSAVEVAGPVSQSAESLAVLAIEVAMPVQAESSAVMAIEALGLPLESGESVAVSAVEVAGPVSQSAESLAVSAVEVALVATSSGGPDPDEVRWFAEAAGVFDLGAILHAATESGDLDDALRNLYSD